MTQQQISRRTVVKGAAWATPAVVAATAMPAFAASCDPSVQLRTFLARHEYQGKGYTYRLAFIGGTPGSPYTGLVVAGLTPSHTIEGATIELMLSDVSDDVHFEPDPSSAIGDFAHEPEVVEDLLLVLNQPGSETALIAVSGQGLGKSVPVQRRKQPSRH